MPGLSLAVLIVAVWFLARLNNAAKRAKARRQASDPAPAPSPAPVPAAGEPPKAPAAQEAAPFREGVFREGAPGSLVFREDEMNEEEKDPAADIPEEHAPHADEWMRAVVMSEVLKRPSERRRIPYGR